MWAFWGSLGLIAVWTFLALKALSEMSEKSTDTEHAWVPRKSPNLVLRLFYRLGRLPALLFILLYIGLVFGFAVIYVSLPSGHFYHETSKYEYGPLGAEASEIIQEVEKSVYQSFVDHYGQNIVLENGWILDASKFKISKIDVDDFPEYVGLRVRYSSEFVSNGQTYLMINSPATLDIPFEIYVITGDVVYFFPEIQESASAPLSGFSAPPSVADFLVSGQSEIGDSSPVLALPLALYDRINALGQGYRGFPSSVRGHWVRMLYFSAGIATSNAFGDIVPLTTLARTLVTVEAIATILIVGLFLNSLGSMISARSVDFNVYREP